MANAPIEATLERVAASDSAFDQKCFERFFQMSEEGESLMAHMDHVHRGKMMAEIYRLLLAEKLEDEADYLNWEAKNHETAYFVPKNLYPMFMKAFKHSWPTPWVRMVQRRIRRLSLLAAIRSLTKFNPDTVNKP